MTGRKKVWTTLTSKSALAAVVGIVPAKSGVTFEKIIKMLVDNGFVMLNKNNPNARSKKRWIEKNVPYHNLTNRKRLEYKYKIPSKRPRTEYVLHAKDANSTLEFPMQTGIPLVIRLEFKWQQSSGTAREKLPSAVINLQYTPEANAILLLGGKEYQGVYLDMAKEWCEDGIHWAREPKLQNTRIRAMSLDEFIDWCNRAFG